DHEAFFDGAGRHADIANLAVDDGFDALEVGHESPFSDGGDVRADAALFLGFATAPDMAALDGARAGQFTNSCPKNASNLRSGEPTNLTPRGKLYLQRL